MAGDLWNRVNIPFPSAVSSVRVPFNSTTDAHVHSLLVENETVLKLIRSEILETEIRVLYELQYTLNNSLRGNKTFKGLKQVEQCINRLKSMKLDVALQGLTELCPTRIKRSLSIKAGEGDVPSQPFLEWLCLKVLGGAQLMSCTLDRCSRTFVLSKQHMKWEFAIMNMVMTSMLSRLWVFFRGILVSLSTLYQRLLELLREVASAQSMPYLTDFSLPADMTQFLGTPETFRVIKRSAHPPRGREKDKRQGRNEKRNVTVKNRERTKKAKEDIGVAVERGRVLDTDPAPFFSVFRNLTKGKRLPQETHRTDRKEVFKKKVSAATTVTDMMARLKEMIRWSKSQKMKKERCLLTSLYLRCLRLKCLEAAGYNPSVQRKLQTLRQKALWALSPHGAVPQPCQSCVATRSKACQRNRFHSLRGRLKSSALRAGMKMKQRKRQNKRADSSAPLLSGEDKRHRTTETMTSQTTGNESLDDIDDIFSSLGL